MGSNDEDGGSIHLDNNMPVVLIPVNSSIENLFLSFDHGCRFLDNRPYITFQLCFDAKCEQVYQEYMMHINAYGEALASCFHSSYPFCHKSGYDYSKDTTYREPACAKGGLDVVRLGDPQCSRTHQDDASENKASELQVQGFLETHPEVESLTLCSDSLCPGLCQHLIERTSIGCNRDASLSPNPPADGCYKTASSEDYRVDCDEYIEKEECDIIDSLQLLESPASSSLLMERSITIQDPTSSQAATAISGATSTRGSSDNSSSLMMVLFPLLLFGIIYCAFIRRRRSGYTKSEEKHISEDDAKLLQLEMHTRIHKSFGK